MGVSIREKIKGSGEFWIFIAHNNKRTSRKVGSKAAATAAAKEIEKKLAIADFLPEPSQAPTVGARWQHFDKNYLSLKSESKANNYRQNFRLHILPTFEDTPMDQITDEAIEAWIAELVLVKKLGKGTIETVVREFARLFTHARKVVNGSNPCVGISHLWANAKPKKPIFPFTREESALFLATAFEHEPAHYSQVLSLLHTGMRPGENAGWCWEDIDWTNNRTWIRRSIDFENGKTDGKIGKVVETKTKDVRTVDLSDELITALKQHRANQREYWLRKGQPAPPWVFPNEVGGWMNMDALRMRAFKRVLTKAGLAGRDLYDLRHTYASQMLQNGAQPTYVAKQCGHSLEVLLRIYAHYLPDTSDRQHLNGLPGRSSNLHPGCTQPEDTAVNTSYA